MHGAASLCSGEALEDLMTRRIPSPTWQLLSIALCVALGLTARPTMVLAQGGGSSADPPLPCESIELLCGAHGPRGDPAEDPNCECGLGEWVRIDTPPDLDPEIPVNMRIARSADFVDWKLQCTRRATASLVSVEVDASAVSHFGATGSDTTKAKASCSGGWRELWRGTLPACPRRVSLAAIGSGSLSIAASCAAEPGCTASAATSASGSASSRGDASASIDGLHLDGTVGFQESSHSTELSGNFGATVDFIAPSIDGSLSSERRWSVKGDGSATGTLSYTVKPNRTYCALTNLPIHAHWDLSAVATTALSVDRGGTAAATAGATMLLRIQ